MTPAQCRAARALLDWSQGDLARRSDVAARTVRTFETGLREISEAKLEALQTALEKGGVEFTNGDEPGVKLRRRGKR
jgi:transcriptional regulator with XRE-family HTH domain